MANLTQVLLAAISVSFLKIFNSALNSVETDYEKIATVIDVKTMSADYAWLGGFSKMREWVGDRVLKELKAHSYTITKKDFESTIEVDRDVIEYDQLGIIKPQIQQMAHDAQTHYDEIVFPLLESNGKCYDKQNFFSDAHPVGSSTMSNITDKKLSADSFLEARKEMRGLTSDDAKALKIKPSLLVVPPELEAMAIKILKQDRLDNGQSNITKDMCDYLVADDLSDGDAWYLLDTTRPLKPIILQRSKKIKFSAMDKVDDENVFMRKKFRYGVDSQDNAGYGLWQLAYKSTGTV